MGAIIITDLNVNIYADFFVYTLERWLTTNDSRDDVAFVRDLSNSIVFAREVVGAILEPKPKSSRAAKNAQSV